MYFISIQGLALFGRSEIKNLHFAKDGRPKPALSGVCMRGWGVKHFPLPFYVLLAALMSNSHEIGYIKENNQI